MIKKRAFSLLELSVVLLVIGLISAGIMKGVSIIRTSRLASARSLTVNSKINEIPGMIAWYETTMKESFDPDEALDNGQVASWYDISPESIDEQRNTLTRTASADVTYRELGINSLPSVQFTSSGVFTLSDFFQGAYDKFTIFTVMQPTVSLSATYLTILDSYSGSSTNYAIAFNATSIRITDSSAHSKAQVFQQSNPYVIAIYFNDSDLDNYVNNTTTPIAQTGGTTSLSGLTVGADENVANAFTGFVSEIIIYNRVISDSERKAIMAYLGQKYNIRVTGAY